jgi:uncharacterized protein YecA (UPF0149 family)
MIPPPKFEDEFPEAAKCLMEIYANRKRFSGNYMSGRYFPAWFRSNDWDNQFNLADGILKAYREWKFVGVGRNDKCPCNSGKKFKHCCLK